MKNPRINRIIGYTVMMIGFVRIVDDVLDNICFGRQCYENRAI